MASDLAAAEMACRVGCGACCIAPTISTPIPGPTPGMPLGKPAGVRCVQLTEDNRCQLFGQPERPAVCEHLRPNRLMCGASADAALTYLWALELETRPAVVQVAVPREPAEGGQPA